MLKTIQTIALVQGLFLVIIIFKHRSYYKKPNFNLLLGCTISVMLYAIGDDDYNLFVNNANWFIFHDTLIITFLFLFIRYYKSDKEKFQKKDVLFFIPYLLNTILHAGYVFGVLKATGLLLAIKELVEITFFVYLILTIHNIIKNKKGKWLLLVVVPLTTIFIIDELTFLITGTNDSPFFLDSYGVFITTIILFYFVVYKLITSPGKVLPKPETSKYKSSSLQQDDISVYISEINHLMKEKKLFRNQNLNVNDVAKQLNIPRTYLSQILNVHMKMAFQDLLNHYRVDDFISCLHKEEYKNYTLLGIANEVGFGSKSSFNTTFKKLKGMTPSQFKKQLL